MSTTGSTETTVQDLLNSIAEARRRLKEPNNIEDLRTRLFDIDDAAWSFVDDEELR